MDIELNTEKMTAKIEDGIGWMTFNNPEDTMPWRLRCGKEWEISWRPSTATRTFEL